MSFLPPQFRKGSLRGFGQRAVASLLLLNWVVLTLGIPLPVRVSKDRSQPFPCMDSVCGCRNAAKCWKSCCCHTDAEKLAWAKQHGVKPPAFVVEAAQREAGSCHQSGKANCHASLHCEQKHGQDALPEEQSSAAETTDTIVLISMQRCQGQRFLWLGDIQGIPPVVLLPAGSLSPGEWVTLSDQKPESLDPAPPIPPPRLAAI
jgi:hypothetical protein